MSEEESSINPPRRRFLVQATSLVAATGVAGAAIPFLSSWRPNARAKAGGAVVSIDVGKLERGAMITLEWRGKPVYILRRSPEQLAGLTTLGDRLADPESIKSEQPDFARVEWRSSNPEYLVVIGLCTHLGCTPKLRNEDDKSLGADWRGGFFCPCHGSRFDFSGRVYKNVPAAPINLSVPPYVFEGESVIVIGREEEAVG